MSNPNKTLFLVGPGLIGTSLLVSLKSQRPDLHLHALTRREEQATQLKSLGITPVLGSLSDHDLIADWSTRADIIIHAASADDDVGSSAIVDGILSRPQGSKKVVYIQTSGNDELINSARDLPSTASAQERTLSDTWSNAQLEARIAPDAPHRNVDAALRQRLFNNDAEKAHNAVTSIMMPPLIYGVGSEPFKRLSIQTPMITRYMMSGGAFTLPRDNEQGWNQVWIHDLVRAYLVLIEQCERAQPGDVGSQGSTRTSHYVFPAEEERFKWKDLFDAVVGQLKKAGHPCANDVHVLTGQEDFKKRIGGDDNAYSQWFEQLVYGTKNSSTRPDWLSRNGFHHTARGVVDSVVRGGELESVVRGGA